MNSLKNSQGTVPKFALIPSVSKVSCQNN